MSRVSAPANPARIRYRLRASVLHGSMSAYARQFVEQMPEKGELRHRTDSRHRTGHPGHVNRPSPITGSRNTSLLCALVSNISTSGEPVVSQSEAASSSAFKTSSEHNPKSIKHRATSSPTCPLLRTQRPPTLATGRATMATRSSASTERWPRSVQELDRYKSTTST